jgi:multiple sugar transport system substrate-binding protein
MTHVTRRKLLKLSGASAAAASTGGLASILASARAPAFAQAQTVHWLRWVDFVPASDQLLKRDVVAECEKTLGIKLTVETINGNDIQARTTSAIQSGSGPDVICALNNWPQLYAESVVDVNDVAETIGKAQGGFYDELIQVGYDAVGKRWLGVPWTIVPAQIAYRKSWFEAAGSPKFPTTWEEYRAVGKKLKAAGHPIGQTLGHTFGDAPTFAYPYLWSWGGKEVEADGKTVALNSKETIESVKFMTDFYKDAHDEGGLAWDDTNNNRAFLSGTISATLNGASIYIESLRKPDSYQTDKGRPMKEDILHAPLPRGPAGQFSYHAPFTNMLMKYSKQQDAAKKLLAWISSKDGHDKWFLSQKGFSIGATKDWQKHKMWDEDPVMLPFRNAADNAKFPGYPGPAGRKAAEALSKYIVIDMYAKAVQGMPAEAAVKWAHDEMAKVYA